MSEFKNQWDINTKIEKYDIGIGIDVNIEGDTVEELLVKRENFQENEFVNITLNGEEDRVGLVNVVDKENDQYKLKRMTKINLISQLLSADTAEDYVAFFKKNGFIINLLPHEFHNKFDFENTKKLLELIKTIALIQNELAKNTLYRDYIDYDELLRLFIKLTLFKETTLKNKIENNAQPLVIKPPSDNFEILADRTLYSLSKHGLCDLGDEIYELETHKPIDCANLMRHIVLEDGTDQLSISVLSFYKEITEEHSKKVGYQFYQIEDLNASDLSMPLKKQLLSLCKSICQCYINEGNKKLQVEIDLESGTTKLIVPDLISALFYNLTYFDFGKYRYKRCEAPGCNKYFISSVSRPSRGCCKAHISTISSKDYYNNPEHNKSKKK